MRAPMTHKFNLILLLGLLLVSPQLAACAEVKASYPVQDTGLHAERSSELVWLDNHRLRFYGYRAGEPQGREFHGVPRLIGAGYYIWDMDANRLVTEPILEGAMRLCVQGDYMTFLRKSPTDESKWLVVTRVNGQETVSPLVNAQWFNRFSCRYYEQKPWWVIENHRTLPLLDEHGYLDWTPSPGDEDLHNWPIKFHSNIRLDVSVLPVGSREALITLVQHIPFKNVYLFQSDQYDYSGKGDWKSPYPAEAIRQVLWLAPDGRVTKQLIQPKPWMSGERFHAIRDGLFVTSRGIIDLDKPGVAGGYVLKEDRATKVISGLLEDVAVSPDGCKVAVVHDPYTKEPFFERANVKVISTCEDAHHAR